jgi:hypothetical protein
MGRPRHECHELWVAPRHAGPVPRIGAGCWTSRLGTGNAVQRGRQAEELGPFDR